VVAKLFLPLKTFIELVYMIPMLDFEWVRFEMFGFPFGYLIPCAGNTTVFIVFATFYCLIYF
jgi:putative solute:sodium symporter small subunit